MLICEIEYSHRPEKWSDEVYAEMRKLWPCNSWPEDRSKTTYFPVTRQRLSMDEAAAIEALGVKLDIEGVDGTMITKLKDRPSPSGYEDTLDRLREGSAVQIAIPDLGLMVINEVEVLDDSCTHRLQDYLDKGWRILAVCPPNAARRPDYVLGRKKP